MICPWSAEEFTPHNPDQKYARPEYRRAHHSARRKFWDFAERTITTPGELKAFVDWVESRQTPDENPCMEREKAEVQ